jgi:ABC-2 type transport system permease protein
VNGSLGRISAIARKEFRQITRDRRSLVFALGMPVFMLVLFAYALSFDVRNVPTVLVDQDHTPMSRQFADTVAHSGFFLVKANLQTETQVEQAFDTGAARAAVVIARGFGDQIAAGRKGRVALLLDGSEPNSAQLGQSYGNAIAQLWGSQITIQGLEAQGVQPGRFGGVQPSIRMWYNPEAKSSAFLVPGLIVVIIMIVTVLQTATSLVREEDSGTLEQLLVSPLKRWELVVGKVTPWVALAAIDIVVITLLAVFVIGIPFRGSVVLFGVGSALFLLCALALGIFISAIANSVEVANQIAIIVSFLPAFMLSGFVFPLANIPVVLQWASYLFPARYMIVISRAEFLKGTGLDILWPQFAALAIYAVVALTLATVAYRNKLR